ncbi:hypothetical protein H8D04_01610 [bacterium]|nr:hypothetical protein [bacterium]
MKKLKCEVCGFESVNLVSHISRRHMKIQEYKSKFGDYPLIIYSDEQLKKISDTTKKNNISPYKIEHWVNKGYSIKDAKYEISIRRPYNINYWINKFGDVIGKEKYYDFITKGTSEIGFIEKYGEVDGALKFKEFQNKKKKTNKRCIEYWMELGFSKSESKDMVSKEQSTFSMETCINKYGKEIGIQKFNERQEKWQNTLNSKSQKEIDFINEKKDSSSIEYYKNKYGKSWKHKIKQRKFGNNNVAMKCVKNCNSINDLVNYIPNNFSYKKITQILSSKIVREIFNIDSNNEIQLYKMIFNKYDFDVIKSNAKYGTLVAYDGILYRSLGEVEIAKFMTENNIDFAYEKKYPYQDNIGHKRFLYDFHLPKYDIYIEYTGLSGGNLKYDKRLLKKQKFCIDNNINTFFSNSTNEIIKKLTDIINE